MLAQQRHKPNQAAELLEWIAGALGLVLLGYGAYRLLGAQIAQWVQGLISSIGS